MVDKKQKLLRNLLWEGALSEGDAITVVKRYPELVNALCKSDDPDERALAFRIVYDVGYVPNSIYDGLTVAAENGELLNVLALLYRTHIPGVTAVACQSCIDTPPPAVWLYLATEASHRVSPDSRAVLSASETFDRTTQVRRPLYFHHASTAELSLASSCP